MGHARFFVLVPIVPALSTFTSSDEFMQTSASALCAETGQLYFVCSFFTYMFSSRSHLIVTCFMCGLRFCDIVGNALVAAQGSIRPYEKILRSTDNRTTDESVSAAECDYALSAGAEHQSYSGLESRYGYKPM
jgi:hypothetical protein